MAAKEHIKQSVEAYAKARPKYEAFANGICELIGEHCGKDLIHTTQFRAKTVESFERKYRKVDEYGRLRYPHPLKDITDLAGVRIIVFVRDSVDEICKKIQSVLNVIEIEDVGERVYSRGKFGYQSKHLLVALGDDRQKLVENQRFEGLVCEVQVRTLLQHAWAEMEHDIQYKSDKEIPIDLKKRFSALAGLLEIADREFQSIQRDSDNLKEAVKAELISDLTRQGFSEGASDTNTSGAEVERTKTARALVNEGDYRRAIEVYTAKIKNDPKAATLYIGRAKSKFLAGDTSGAISDLSYADKLLPGNPVTMRLRAAIEHGDTKAVTIRNLPDDAEISGRLAAAAAALEAGDGIKAFEEYSLLDAAGYNKAIILFGKAMCCALERDVAGSRGFLNNLKILPATPMSVNICALHCFLDILGDGKIGTNHQDMLREAIERMPTYVFDLSALKPLFSGLKAKKLASLPIVEELFQSIGADGKRFPILE